MVEKVGASVSGLKPGDEVFGEANGRAARFSLFLLIAEFEKRIWEAHRLIDAVACAVQPVEVQPASLRPSVVVARQEDYRDRDHYRRSGLPVLRGILALAMSARPARYSAVAAKRCQRKWVPVGSCSHTELSIERNVSAAMRAKPAQSSVHRSALFCNEWRTPRPNTAAKAGA